ncbi:MAG: O-antigen ligase family protein [Actinobacteria bacterium]|nr:MAG: O-antigen ligase family protein [Actinomycetota bacterium]
MKSAETNYLRFWYWLEYLYVVVLVATLTQGPVNKIWEGSGQLDSRVIEITKFATYLLVQAPAAFLLTRRGISKKQLTGPVGVLLGFVGWMLLSTLWATSSSNTLFEAVTLTMTCFAGLYVATSFTLVQQLSLFFVAMQPGLFFSWFAVWQNWSSSIQIEDGNWVGIYFNRNSLAPTAALGLLCAAALVWIVLIRRPKQWMAFTAVFLALLMFDGFVLLRSGSSTSVGAILVFGSVWAFWTIVRWLKRRINISPRQMLLSVYTGFLVALISVTTLVFYFQKRLLDLVGKKIDFNGREVLWRFSWDGFTDRPIIGWGWMSAWRTQEFFKKREFWWSLTNSYWSHSAMMDVLLGGGVIGATLLVVVIVWSGAQQLERVYTQTAGQWTFAATWFVIAASTQESFIIGNHFLWLLLVASLTGVKDDSSIGLG